MLLVLTSRNTADFFLWSSSEKMEKPIKKLIYYSVLVDMEWM